MYFPVCRIRCENVTLICLGEYVKECVVNSPPGHSFSLTTTSSLIPADLCRPSLGAAVSVWPVSLHSDVNVQFQRSTYTVHVLFFSVYFVSQCLMSASWHLNPKISLRCRKSWWIMSPPSCHHRDSTASGQPKPCLLITAEKVCYNTTAFFCCTIKMF